MATINFYLKEPQAKKETPIYLAFTSGEKRFKFYTNKKINPKFWDKEKQQPKKSFTNAGEWRGYFKSLEGETEKIHTRFQTMNKPFTLNDIRKELCIKYERAAKDEPLTFIQFIDNHIESVTGQKRGQTISAYKTSLESLREFQKTYRKRIDFVSIDLDFYNDYTQWLVNEKKYSPNTVGKYIKHLKLFLNEATERGLNTKMDFKSKKFKKPSEETESIYLSEKELLKLYKLDLSDQKKLESVRDLFIVGCYTGLRFSDFSQIKKDDIKGDYLNIRTQKTDALIVIPIHELVKKILRKYNKLYENSLPRSISNQKMNEYLKIVGEKGGLKEIVVLTKSSGGMKIKTSVEKYKLITTHTARRSFATNMYLKGYPINLIMKITGHRTEKSFLRYIKMSPQESATKLKQLWSKQSKLKAV
jgi:integrase